jgi:exoribonuclease-2
MKTGNIVEYIDKQKIICAVVLEVKNMRLRLLTETNREINMPSSRLLPCSEYKVDLTMGRDNLVSTLKLLASKRNSLLKDVDLVELWEVLNTEQEWIDLGTMTEFCFPENPTPDHQSAVRRAFFNDKYLFKFKTDSFFPNSAGQVETIKSRIQEKTLRLKRIEKSAEWLKNALNSNELPKNRTADELDVIGLLKDYYLFEQDCQDYNLAKEILDRVGIEDSSEVFGILLQLGVWRQDENTDLLALDIPTEFSQEATEHVSHLISHSNSLSLEYRKDFTTLPMVTIDGQATLDYDDALSIEKAGDGYRLGIHIADVGHYVAKGDLIDQEASNRGSSIYMPDLKIPMIPPPLAEDLCSLRAGEKRSAISIMVMLSATGEIQSFEIVPSLIKVERQLSYFDSNMIFEQDVEIYTLYVLAKNFHYKRLEKGAVLINLPEINVWLNEVGEPNISRTNRESPGRFLVSELMILANWLMAKFLEEKQVPAIYRSQPEPKERLFEKGEGSLFDNWMQRKLLNRFVLGTSPEHHSGLGLDAYVTATSPIRKYWDLVVQRQVRAALGLENPYSKAEICRIIQLIENPMNNVSRLQYRRHRYWLLKCMEAEQGRKLEALVLGKRRNGYQVLLTDFMIECTLPSCPGIELRPEDMIKVTLQHVNARKDTVIVYL